MYMYKHTYIYIYTQKEIISIPVNQAEIKLFMYVSESSKNPLT